MPYKKFSLKPANLYLGRLELAAKNSQSVPCEVRQPTIFRVGDELDQLADVRRSLGGHDASSMQCLRIALMSMVRC